MDVYETLTHSTNFPIVTGKLSKIQLKTWFIDINSITHCFSNQVPQLLLGNLIQLGTWLPDTVIHSLVIPSSPVATGELSTAWNLVFSCIYHTLLLIPWLYQVPQLLLGNLVQLGMWILGVCQTLLLIPWLSSCYWGTWILVQL